MKKKVLALLMVGLAMLFPLNVKAQSTSQFIAKVKDDVVSIAAEKNIYASVMMAQAIIESGNGNSSLARDYNNYFGMKGAGVVMKTSEQSGGGYYNTRSSFQSFPTAKDGFRAYANLFYRNSRTYRGYLNARGANEAAMSLQGVYATSKTYGSKLIGVMQAHNLYALDEEASKLRARWKAEEAKNAKLIENFKDKRKKLDERLAQKAEEIYNIEFARLNQPFNASVEVEREKLLNGNINLYYGVEDIARIFGIGKSEAKTYYNEFLKIIKEKKLVEKYSMKSATKENLIRSLEFNKFLYTKLTYGIDFANKNVGN